MPGIRMPEMAGDDRIGPHNLMMQCCASVVFGDNGTQAVIAHSYNILTVLRATAAPTTGRYQVVLSRKFDKLGAVNLYTIQASIQNLDGTYGVADNAPVHVQTTFEADDIIGVSVYDSDTPARQWLLNTATVPNQNVHLMLFGRRILDANGPVKSLGSYNDRWGVP